MRTLGHGRRKDQAAGALVGLLGLAAALMGKTYPLGTPSQMGPGMFPVALGVLLMLVGVVLVATASASADEAGGPAVVPEWRGWACIALAIIAFAVVGQYGGLVPATFVIVLISALGDRRNGILRSLILAAGMVVVCLVVFWWALQVQLPPFEWG